MLYRSRNRGISPGGTTSGGGAGLTSPLLEPRPPLPTVATRIIRTTMVTPATAKKRTTQWPSTILAADNEFLCSLWGIQDCVALSWGGVPTCRPAVELWCWHNACRKSVMRAARPTDAAPYANVDILLSLAGWRSAGIREGEAAWWDRVGRPDWACESSHCEMASLAGFLGPRGEAMQFMLWLTSKGVLPAVQRRAVGSSAGHRLSAPFPAPFSQAMTPQLNDCGCKRRERLIHCDAVPDKTAASAQSALSECRCRAKVDDT